MSLQNLASKQSNNTQAKPSHRSQRTRLDRILAWLPLYLILGFLGVGWYLFGDVIIPARSVTITTVVTQKAEPQGSTNAVDFAGMENPFEGEVLFQASGWIEAAPLPTRATALVDGVVNEVLVLEGQHVKQGQLLATLITEDTEIALDEARARQKEAESEVERVASRIPVIQAQLKIHALEVKTQKAELEILHDDAKRFEAAGSEAFAERDVLQARLRVQTGEAELLALRAREIELNSELTTAEETIQLAESRVEVAQAILARAQLDNERTRIYSPIDGIIQELYVTPGMKRMLMMDNPESSTIAKLYDPENLQARIDVPLEDAAQLSVGQPVVIRSNLLPQRVFHGFVSRIVGMADIQRNTLQAKVTLQEPDPQLRPDMLCRAEFLASPVSSKSSSTSGGRVLIFAPESALLERSGNEATVWTLDEAGERAQKQNVRLGSQKQEGYVEVSDGLHPGAPVILNPSSDLTEGERVRDVKP